MLNHDDTAVGMMVVVMMVMVAARGGGGGDRRNLFGLRRDTQGEHDGDESEYSFHILWDRQ